MPSNRYLTKVSSWINDRDQRPEGVLTRQEVDSLVDSSGMTAKIIHADPSEYRAIKDLSPLMSEMTPETPKKYILESELYGPAALMKDKKKGFNSNVILGGGRNDTNALMHELGHIIDYKDGEDTFKLKATQLAQRLADSDAVKLGLGALATNRRFGLAAPVVAAAIHAPILRSELAANANAARLIRHIKGEDAANRYIVAQAPEFNSYVKPVVGAAATLGAIALASRNRDSIINLARKIANA